MVAKIADQVETLIEYKVCYAANILSPKAVILRKISDGCLDATNSLVSFMLHLFACPSRLPAGGPAEAALRGITHHSHPHIVYVAIDAALPHAARLRRAAR